MFKEIARIGKSRLVTVLGVTRNYKRTLELADAKEVDCPVDCPASSLSIQEKEFYCASRCPYHSHQQKQEYVNEKHRYKLKEITQYDEKRLSRLQLLQFTLYHFLPIDSLGIIKYVSTKELAQWLHCHPKTVLQNQEVLFQMGLIDYSKIESGLYTVMVRGYQQYHLTTDEGGTGYLQVAKEFFSELLEMKNVNHVRAALRQHLLYDNEVMLKKSSTCQISYRDIAQYMPTYVNHPRIILTVIQATDHLFDITTQQKTILMTMKDIYNGKLLRLQKEVSFSQQIKNYFETHHLSLYEHEQEDLAQIAMEYGLQFLLESLPLVDFERQGSPIRNMGGLIRSLLQSLVLQKYIA